MKPNYPILTLVYMALIFASSLVPGSGGSGEGLRAMVMNLLHIPEYGLLTFLLIKTFQSGSWGVGLLERWGARVPGYLGTAILAFVIAFSHGVLNEFIQSLTPGRLPSIGDMVHNAIGACIAIILINKEARN